MNDRNLPAIVAAAALPMSPEQVRDHVNAVQKVMKAVMKERVHYGTIPGTPKPTLYKPGAEVLCMAFHIDPTFEVQDLSTGDYYRYRVRCIGRHQQTEIKLGEGMGSASSSEEKYKWRKVVCDEEFEIAAEGRKRIKFGKGQEGIYKVKQLRAEPDDIDNTVLKMACKRAHIAMVLNVLAASDIFTQDIEDLPEHLRTEDAPPDAELLAKWVAAAAAAADSEALKKVYEDGKAEMRAANDAAAYQAFKKTVEERANALKGTKPVLSEEHFNASLKKWSELVAKKKKTADEIIATAQTKNALTDDQVKAIRALAPKEAADASAKATSEAIVAMVERGAEGEISISDICKHLGVPKLEGITVGQVAQALAFIHDPVGATK